MTKVNDKYKGMSIIERLESNTYSLGSCKIWKLRKNVDGYGTVKIKGKSLLVHRVLYEQYKGEIKFEINHTCEIRDCINIEHLEDVTHKVNMEQRGNGWTKTSITHCPQGHEYAGENLYYNNNHRRCRECSRNYYRKKAGIVIID